MQFPNKRYNTIVIDPPWEISLTGDVNRRQNRAKKLPYKTMSLKEIKEIPLGDIANKGCHVYCWTTNKMLKETFEVLESWGVNFHLVMPLVKPSGIAPCMGYVFASEFCLLGFYGKPMQKFNKMGRLNWIKSFNKFGTHSSKPEEFYDLVKEMSPEPRIDVFSRKEHNGFDVWGDEAPTNKLCPRCHNTVSLSDLEDYPYVCYDCDENFYEFETKKCQQDIKNAPNQSPQTKTLKRSDDESSIASTKTSELHDVGVSTRLLTDKTGNTNVEDEIKKELLKDYEK